MSALAKPKLTPQEYLAIERRASSKSEYYNGEMFGMAGASGPHVDIAFNLARHLGNQLAGTGCRPRGMDLRVHVPSTGLFTYPDMLIVCGPSEWLEGEFDTLLNPQVIIEILSPSTEKYDRGPKFRQYKQLPSFREYLLVARDEPLIECFVRQPNGTWLVDEVIGLDAELALATVPVRVALADIYADVTFPELPLREPTPRP